MAPVSPACAAHTGKFQGTMPDGSTYDAVTPDKSSPSGSLSDARTQNALNPPRVLSFAGPNLPRLQTAPSNLILPNPQQSADLGRGIIGQSSDDALAGGILGNGPALSFGGLLGDQNRQGGNGEPLSGAPVGLVGGGMFAAPANKWTQLSANTGQNAGSNGDGSDGGMFVNNAAMQKGFSAPDNGIRLFEPKPTPYQQAATDQLSALGLGNGVGTGNLATDRGPRGTLDRSATAANDGRSIKTSSGTAGASPSALSAAYSGNRTVTFTNADGTKRSVTDDHPERDNNPLDLKVGAAATNNGSIGTDQHFAIFPDADHGYAAAIQRLSEVANMPSRHNQPAGSIANVIYIWSPPEDHNDTEGMISDITAATGLNRNSQYSSLTAAQKNAFVHAYAKREGCRSR